MPRRRYKLFMVCAAVFCFMLYRVYLNSGIDYETPSLHWPAARPAGGTTGEELSHAADKVPLAHAPPPMPQDDRWNDNQGKPAKGKHDEDSLTGGSKSGAPESKDKDSASGKTTGDNGEPLRWKDPPKGPGSSKPKQDDDPTKIHWKKFPEHFPIMEESLITLPTGTPKKLPKVQHEFAIESASDKAEREKRRDRVKAEISRAWAGYKKFAWAHDELSPVSGKSRDPFCGWAATLVDSLDTLWIAGLKSEFDEAAKAVADIDFTWTKRDSIPVFETTIRYLGGLIAAYDLSEYNVLLEKAVELAEILMGIFDTPNRMPVLYYAWKPESASQPHRASRVGIAELGTLSMEFTRLAQITGKEKYYDAVDRITNALVDLQDRGTSVPGLFPENLDASGCNRTATTERNTLSTKAQEQVAKHVSDEEPVGYTPGSKKSTDEKPAPVKDAEPINRRDAPEVSAKKPPFNARGDSIESDCVPQGLVSSGFGREAFHVGGSQDSVYEYFPKQYVLLGGLEPKYKKLHEDTVDAINKWLMYRPMVKDDWDILFPAKLHTSGNPSKDAALTYEVTHLTCFIGGMFGLGGKIFGREQDVETAKKLTDGCVWAYQSTASGLMPEHAEVAPCPSLEKCEFNQTAWYDLLDTSKDVREKQLAQWEEDQKASNSNKKEARENAVAAPTPMPVAGTKVQKRAAIPPAGAEEDDDGSKLPKSEQDVKPPPVPAADQPPLHAKPVKPLVQGPAVHDEDDGSKMPLNDKLDKPGIKQDGDSGSYKPKKTSLRVEADIHEFDKDVETKPSKAEEASKVGPPSVPKPHPEAEAERPSRTLANSQKPMSHEEFVADKIESSHLTPGYVTIHNPSYILRPEAIESVWYMYRITGDTEWMDKGWKMFEATIHATRTAHANSAIDSVMTEQSSLKDEMESFWLAETLKYYFLLFSEPDVISLDEWVLNTEAHPFKRPTTSLRPNE